MKVLIDTSAWISLFIRSEVTHSSVKSALEKYMKGGALLFTSDYILDETYTRLCYDQSPAALKKAIGYFKEMFSVGDVSMLRVDETIFKRAESVISKYAPLKLSFTDATSFVLFRDLQLDEMLSLDSDFRKLRLVVRPNA